MQYIWPFHKAQVLRSLQDHAQYNFTSERGHSLCNRKISHTKISWSQSVCYLEVPLYIYTSTLHVINSHAILAWAKESVHN